MKRVVQPELLDTLPPEDPLAMGSRRDLRRVNWWMGNHRIMRAALQRHLPADTPGKIWEIGAGDGRFLLSVVKNLPPLRRGRATVLLDRQNAVDTETLVAFGRRGWWAETVVADVLEYSFPPEPVAAIVANLFLHHFGDDRLAALLARMARQTGLFIAVEPHRFSKPAACAALLRLIGCNSVTLNDAEISIRAGFIGKEISVLWPDHNQWRLTERRAGWFSHLFVAERIR